MGRRLAAAVLIAAAALHAEPAVAGYGQSLRQATRNGRIFNLETWDANLIWHATFFSDSFRPKFAEKHVAIHRMNALEAADAAAELGRRQAAGWDFFISFYTKKDYKSFSIEPSSFWKIRLITQSGEVLRPDSIDMIPITPYERVMYPHINRWSKAYRVTFPKVDLGDEFELTLHSVVGESTVTWKAPGRRHRGK